MRSSIVPSITSPAIWIVDAIRIASSSVLIYAFLYFAEGSASPVVGHFVNRAALGTVGISPRELLAVILRVPRVESPFFHAQKVALIEPMNPQWGNLSEERKSEGERKRAEILREARVEFVILFGFRRNW